MKKLSVIFSFALATLFIASCYKNSNTSNSTSKGMVQTQIESNMSISNWTISLFNDSGNDETNHFTGYTFKFENNGKLTTTNGVNTYTGTWSISDSNSKDDSKDDLDFNIHFNLTNDFEDLNDDWDILSYSNNKMELVDVSGGNGGTDYLTFSKL